jgi:hypothetical protein
MVGFAALVAKEESAAGVRQGRLARGGDCPARAARSPRFCADLPGAH